MYVIVVDEIDSKVLWDYKIRFMLRAYKIPFQNVQALV